VRWLGFNVEEVENVNRLSSLRRGHRRNEDPLPCVRRTVLRALATPGSLLLSGNLGEHPHVIRRVRDGETHFRSPDETLGLAILTVQRTVICRRSLPSSRVECAKS